MEYFTANLALQTPRQVQQILELNIFQIKISLYKALTFDFIIL